MFDFKKKGELELALLIKKGSLLINVHPCSRILQIYISICPV